MGVVLLLHHGAGRDCIYTERTGPSGIYWAILFWGDSDVFWASRLCLGLSRPPLSRHLHGMWIVLHGRTGGGVLSAHQENLDLLHSGCDRHPRPSAHLRQVPFLHDGLRHWPARRLLSVFEDVSFC